MKLVELLYQNRDKFTLHPDCKWLSQDHDGVVNQHLVKPDFVKSTKDYSASKFISYLNHTDSTVEIYFDLCSDQREPLSREEYEQYCKEQDEQKPQDEYETIDIVINERAGNYGRFEDGAEIIQQLKNVVRSTEGWKRLKPNQAEAIEMILHKIGRIVNGNPMYEDSWVDISGYSKLIADWLKGESK